MAPKKKLTKEEQEAERLRLEEEARLAEQGVLPMVSAVENKGWDSRNRMRMHLQSVSDNWNWKRLHGLKSRSVERSSGRQSKIVRERGSGGRGAYSYLIRTSGPVQCVYDRYLTGVL